MKLPYSADHDTITIVFQSPLMEILTSHDHRGRGFPLVPVLPGLCASQSLRRRPFTTEPVLRFAGRYEIDGTGESRVASVSVKRKRLFRGGKRDVTKKLKKEKSRADGP